MKLQSINSHDQSIVGELGISTSDEVVRAIEKVRQTFEKWKELSVEQGCTYAKKLKGKLQGNRDKLARLWNKPNQAVSLLQ